MRFRDLFSFGHRGGSPEAEPDQAQPEDTQPSPEQPMPTEPPTDPVQPPEAKDALSENESASPLPDLHDQKKDQKDVTLHDPDSTMTVDRMEAFINSYSDLAERYKDAANSADQNLRITYTDAYNQVNETIDKYYTSAAEKIMGDHQEVNAEIPANHKIILLEDLSRRKTESVLAKLQLSKMGFANYTEALDKLGVRGNEGVSDGNLKVVLEKGDQEFKNSRIWQNIRRSLIGGGIAAGTAIVLSLLLPIASPVIIGGAVGSAAGGFLGRGFAEIRRQARLNKTESSAGKQIAYNEELIKDSLAVLSNSMSEFEELKKIDQNDEIEDSEKANQRATALNTIFANYLNPKDDRSEEYNKIEKSFRTKYILGGAIGSFIGGAIGSGIGSSIQHAQEVAAKSAEYAKHLKDIEGGKYEFNLDSIEPSHVIQKVGEKWQYIVKDGEGEQVGMLHDLATEWTDSVAKIVNEQVAQKAADLTQSVVNNLATNMVVFNGLNAVNSGLVDPIANWYKASKEAGHDSIVSRNNRLINSFQAESVNKHVEEATKPDKDIPIVEYAQGHKFDIPVTKKSADRFGLEERVYNNVEVVEKPVILTRTDNGIKVEYILSFDGEKYKVQMEQDKKGIVNNIGILEKIDGPKPSQQEPNSSPEVEEGEKKNIEQICDDIKKEIEAKKPSVRKVRVVIVGKGAKSRKVIMDYNRDNYIVRVDPSADKELVDMINNSNHGEEIEIEVSSPEVSVVNIAKKNKKIIKISAILHK